MPGAIFQVANAFAPEKGPMYYQDTIVLAAANVPTIKNYTLEEMRDALGIVQGAWIDNSLNPDILVITMQVTQQILRIPAFAQGVFPMFAIMPLVFTAQSPTANITIPIGLLNMPTPYGVW